MSDEKRFEKVVRDGEVAVLYSPGFGAGWSTWNRKLGEALVFDSDLVNAVGDYALLAEIVERKYPYAYTSGLRDLEVEWVPQGSRFEIEEHGGHESVRVFGPGDGMIA